MLHYNPQHVSSSIMLMFRRTNCITANLVSSLSVNGRTVCRLRVDCIIILNMFRAVLCSSSGGHIVLLQPLVSSLSVNSRTVCRLRVDCIIILSMFRAVLCSSSGGQIVLLQPMVSSLSVNNCTVCRLYNRILFCGYRS